MLVLGLKYISEKQALKILMAYLLGQKTGPCQVVGKKKGKRKGAFATVGKDIELSDEV